MRRREFIGLSTAIVGLGYRSVGAQESTRARRLGLLMPYERTDPEDQRRIGALLVGLSQLGWNRGESLEIEARWFGGDPARAQTAATELVKLNPDVIVVGSSPGVAAVSGATQSIPVVFVAVSDPVGQGFIHSLAQPEGNITGFTLFEWASAGKLLEVLKEVSPVETVGVLYHPETTSAAPFVAFLREVAPKSKVELVEAPVRSLSDIHRALSDLAKPNGGFLTLPDPFLNFHRAAIAATAIRHKLPAVYPQRFFATDGGLLSYGTDITDLYRRA